MNKKVIKKIISVSLAAITAVGLISACGTGDVQKEKVTISVVTNERSIMDVMERLVENYNDTNDKNIYISYECKDDSYEDYIKTTYTSKNPPDVHLRTGNDNLAIEAGWFREIPEDLAEQYQEEFVSDCIEFKDDKLYSIGLTAGGAQKLLYNKDLFAECGLDPENPPKTFDEMREYAKKITEQGNGVKYGFAMPLKDDIFSRYYVMIPGAPSGLYNRDGFEPATNKFDFSIYKTMIEYMRSLVSDGSVFPTPYTLDNDTARAQFSEGNVGMIFAAAWDVSVYNDQFPAKCDYGIVDYPVFDTLEGGYPYGISTKNQWYMSSMSQHPNEQLEVFKWLNSEEVAKALLEENAITASTRKSLQQNIPTSNKKGAVEFAQRTYPLFKIDAPSEPTGLKISGDDRFTTMKNLVLDETLDIDAKLEELTKKYNDAMDVLAKELEEKEKSIEQYHIPNWSFVVKSEDEM